MRRVPSSDADRVTSVLRVLVPPVILVGEAIASAAPDPGEIVDEVVLYLAGGLALYAVAVLIAVRRATRPALFDLALPAADTAFAVALGLASGGAFSLFSLIFLFAPATTAFQLRPWLTAGVTIVSITAFIGHAFAHLEAHPGLSRAGVVEEVIARTVYLAWAGAVLVALSALLARRDARLRAVGEERRMLVRERLHADDRARSRLALDLHDGALQSILAVRYTLEIGDLDDAVRARSVQMLGDVASEMRGLIADLHPRVLELVGLPAALRALVGRIAERAPEVTFSVQVADGEWLPGAHDVLLYRVAAELVSNVASHARAARASISIEIAETSIGLRVQDDGVGLDPATLPSRLHDGHIGLLSVIERVEGARGSVVFAVASGGGLIVTARVPRVVNEPVGKMSV